MNTNLKPASIVVDRHNTLLIGFDDYEAFLLCAQKLQACLQQGFLNYDSQLCDTNETHAANGGNAYEISLINPTLPTGNNQENRADSKTVETNTNLIVDGNTLVSLGLTDAVLQQTQVEWASYPVTLWREMETAPEVRSVEVYQSSDVWGHDAMHNLQLPILSLTFTNPWHGGFEGLEIIRQLAEEQGIMLTHSSHGHMMDQGSPSIIYHFAKSGDQTLFEVELLGGSVMHISQNARPLFSSADMGTLDVTEVQWQAWQSSATGKPKHR